MHVAEYRIPLVTALKKFRQGSMIDRRKSWQIFHNRFHHYHSPSFNYSGFPIFTAATSFIPFFVKTLAICSFLLYIFFVYLYFKIAIMKIVATFPNSKIIKNNPDTQL